MPYDARKNTERTKLERALLTAAAVVERYQSTPFEADAIRLFERVEREHKAQLQRADAKSRALSLLVTTERL